MSALESLRRHLPRKRLRRASRHERDATARLPLVRRRTIPELFRGSPIKRIKRRGFLRNVCVALGNVGTENDLPALNAAAEDPEPLIREHASWAIEQIHGRQSSNRLQ